MHLWNQQNVNKLYYDSLYFGNLEPNSQYLWGIWDTGTWELSMFHLLSNTLGVFRLYLFIYGSTGVWTHCLKLAWQAFYHLSYFASPVLSCYLFFWNADVLINEWTDKIPVFMYLILWDNKGINKWILFIKRKMVLVEKIIIVVKEIYPEVTFE
jgi:hypothetical protein